MNNNRAFQIIVVGGGHAGIEAALVAARMGCKTAMITFDKNAIGRMSCNPAIGGLAKGQLVREIDALGGEMGYAIDNTGIQFKILNRSKGPAVRARRAQADRALYSKFMTDRVARQENLSIIEGDVVDLIIKKGKCRGVILSNGDNIDSEVVAITAGTFLNGLIHIGLKKTSAGRVGEPASIGLTENLVNLGIETGRLKTGTPPRVEGSTVNFSESEVQLGDNPPPYFSNRSDRSTDIEQSACYLTHTNEDTHRVIRDNLSVSPLYSGQINGIGPRYCPSIEDKVVRFSERPRHQLFLEPEGLETSEYYLNGFSSSLPAEIQHKALKTIPALRSVEMTRPGYAIEYDFFPPHQLYITMESKVVPNLYFAGQVNGTSGYEEAAAQGLIAGINAVLKNSGEESFGLSRSESYIGVLLDDLVTKSTKEPYRMFTSRAEHRLYLRDDNADERLLEKGRKLGLVNDSIFSRFKHNQSQKAEIRALLKSKRIIIGNQNNGDHQEKNVSAFEGLQNPSVKHSNYGIYKEAIAKYGEKTFYDVVIGERYDGYIRRQGRRIDRMKKLEYFSIPPDINYANFRGLKTEAVEKLSLFKPETLGQASRISGVSPGDISVLMIHLKRH